METERQINWLSIFIKIVIIFVFTLIIVWLISKIIGKNKLSDTFKKNIANMETVSVEYFKTVDLPLDKGKSLTITLGELIEKELIISVNEGTNSTCDISESYSKITRAKNKYIVETTLKCGKEKDTIKKDFLLQDCKNCNQETNNESNNNETDNSGSTDNDSHNTSSGTTYYEYVKETTSYTKWMRGSLTGSNIENRYEYYGIAYDTYYTLGVIPSESTSITYTLKLNSVPNNKYYFTTIEEVEGITEDEENIYLSEKKVTLYNKSTSIPSSDIYKNSLTENNFTYKLSPYYSKGEFYIRITITIKNTDNVETYYDNRLQKKVYLVPLKIKVKFASNEISETKPTGEYETISYYRYKIVDREIIWSTEDYVEGYTRTGNTKVE